MAHRLPAPRWLALFMLVLSAGEESETGKDHKPEPFNIYAMKNDISYQSLNTAVKFTGCKTVLLFYQLPSWFDSERCERANNWSKSNRHEKLLPEWLTQSQRSLTDVVLITSEQAITEGHPLRQPHRHHSGPINHTASHDKRVCTGIDIFKKKKKPANSTYYIVGLNNGSSKNNDGEFERRETDVMGEWKQKSVCVTVDENLRPSSQLWAVWEWSGFFCFFL